MASLDELIAAQRAQADIQIQQANQSQKEGEAALATEGAEINPLYGKLIDETNQAYQGNLETARNSASAAGIYRSGIRYNKELALGSAAAKQTGEYGAERTRKLADISRRRTLLAERGKLSTDEINANLGASIADIRYKDYQMQEERKAAAARAAASAAPTEAPLTAEQYAAELAAGGTPWGAAAALVKSRYGDGAMASDGPVDKAFRSIYIGGETNYVAPAENKGIFSGWFNGSGSKKINLSGNKNSVWDPRKNSSSPSWSNLGK